MEYHFGSYPVNSYMSTISSDRPALVLAPHLLYPTRNGADIYVDRMAREISRKVSYVVVVGASHTLRYESGKEVSRTIMAISKRSKWVAAARTVLFKSHYFKEKFITPTYSTAAVAQYKSDDYGMVLFSYIVSAVLIKKLSISPTSKAIVLTHNDEFKWFKDVKLKSKNPLGKMVARASTAWLTSYFSKRNDDVKFVHVSDSDLAGYAQWLNDSNSVVIPLGTDIPDSPVPPRAPNSRPCSVLFVGSLGIGMNGDALEHFANKYYPVLKTEIDPIVRIAGSNPSSRIQTLCQQHGWEFHANISDEALRVLFEKSDAAILPFEYSTGSKLKLLASISHGVPFLATSEVDPPINFVFPPSLVSNEPQQWLSALEKINRNGISKDQRDQLYLTAKGHSWGHSADQLFQIFQD